MKTLIRFQIFCLLCGLLTNPGYSQHFWYADVAAGDIIINEVKVTNTAANRYWETMGWNGGAEGGAYCGIQDRGSSGKGFIFSIWDPSNGQAITAPYSFPGSNVSRFGGEGTGLHWDDNGKVTWTANTWIRAVSRRWAYNGHSFFGFWTYDYATTKWTHQVTMDYPVANVYFDNGGTNSFLENWAGNPEYAKGLYKNGYKRKTDGSWIAFTQATYYGNGQQVEGANGGMQNGAFFLECTGNTTRQAQDGQIFTISIPATPANTAGEVTSASASYSSGNVTVNWGISQNKNPQFSYQIQIINSSGAVVNTRTDKVPHLRNVTYNPGSLANGNYTARVSIVDIYDQTSNTKDATFTVSGGGGGLANGIYTLTGVNSGKCLDVDGWAIDNWSKLIQYSCTGGTNQQFQVTKTSDGFYTFKPMHLPSGVNRVIDVDNCNYSNLVWLQIYDSWGADCQKFQAISKGNNQYTIKTKDGSKCWDIEGYSSADGAHLILWDCTGTNNQKWTFTPVTKSAPIIDMPQGMQPSEITVVPSVVTDVLNIVNLPEGQKYAIYNLSGTKMLECNESTLNVSELSKGMYLIKTEGKVLRFIKE